MNVFDKVIISAGDMSGTLTSSRVDCFDAEHGGIQCVFTGAPVGTLKLQGSLDDSTYSDLSGQTFSVSAPGNHIFEVKNIGFQFLKLVYTFSSGTGALTVRAIMKEYD